MLKFADVWRAPDAAHRATTKPGQVVIRQPGALVSRDVGSTSPESLIVRTDRLALDARCESVRLFVALTTDVSGPIAQFPNLESIVVIPPTRGTAFSLHDAPATLRNVIADAARVRSLGRRDLDRLRVQGVVEADDLDFGALRWLSITPRASAAAIVKAQPGLEVLDLELDVCSLGKLSLLGPQSRLERCSLWWGVFVTSRVSKTGDD